MLDKDDGISTGQVEAQTTDTCRQQQDIIRRVRVELVDNVLALLGWNTTVQPHKLHTRQQLLKNVVLDHVEHLLHLTEDERTVLRDGFGKIAVSCHRLVSSHVRRTDATIHQQILQRAELGRVRNVINRGVALLQVLLRGLVRFVGWALDYQCRRVAELLHVLQRLEDVLLALAVCIAGLGLDLLALAFVEVVKQAALEL
jgi:hypothetical protein